MCDEAKGMREALMEHLFLELCEIIIGYARSLSYDEKLINVLRFDSTANEYGTSEIQFDSNASDDFIVIEWRSRGYNFREKKYSILERYGGRWQRKYEIEFTDLAHDTFSPVMRYSLLTRGAYASNYRSELKNLYFNRMRALIDKY